jgi:hypothetical protein
MIWFSCTKCGRALGRAETSAAAVVFCDCGQGNVVPWESNIAAPAQPPTFPAQGENEASAAEPPLLQAVPIGEEQIPVVRRAPAPATDDAIDPRDRHLDVPRDAKACFNHHDRPGQEKCAACGENFCGDCLVKLKGIPLCGPCKNFRLRQNNRPFTLSIKAVVGVILAMICAPIVMCLLPVGVNEASVVFAVMALVGQLAAMLLGALALRETEKNPRLTGRSLAITTLLTGALGSLMIVCFLLAARK